MIAFLKRIFASFNGDSPSSSLMEKATDSALMDSEQLGQSASFFLSEGAYEFEHYSHNHHDDLEDMMIQQQIRDQHDPYLNPGMDHVVDEYYHGIDHGMDYVDHHHDY